MIKVPLELWNRPHWELQGRPDIVRFFRALGTAFPAATTFFVQGNCIAAAVKVFFESAAEPGPHLPALQTIWPRPRLFRLPVNAPTLERLAELAASHAEPEILDHFFVYAGPDPVLEYPDAFLPGSPIFVARQVPKPQVQWFAQELGLEIAAAGSSGLNA